MDGMSRLQQSSNVGGALRRADAPDVILRAQFAGTAFDCAQAGESGSHIQKSAALAPANSRPTRTAALLWLAVCVCLAPLLACAGAYYVAPSGDDGNPGTRDRPFRTIQKAADTLQPGDTCLVRAGVYRETVRPRKSGVSRSPIRFVAFTNETVTVSGADPLTGWELVSGAIYRTRGWTTEQVFVDGRMLNEARWPRSGPEPLEPGEANVSKRTDRSYAVEGSTPGRLLDPALTRPPTFWNGALVVLLAAHGTWSGVGAVTNSKPGELLYTCPAVTTAPPDCVPGPGDAYFLTRGPLAALDHEGEWWLHQSMGILFVWLPYGEAPTAHALEARRRTWAFDLSGRNYIEVQGFNLFAGGVALLGSKGCRLVDCHLRYPAHTLAPCSPGSLADMNAQGPGGQAAGIVVGGSDNEIRDCSLAYSSGHGILLPPDGAKNRVLDCRIRDVAYLDAGAAAVWAAGTAHTISECSLSRSGGRLLVCDGLQNGRIEYSDLHDGGMLAVACDLLSGWHDGKGTTISRNRIHDSRAARGAGIALDAPSENYVLDHNVLWNLPDQGIVIRGAGTYHCVFNNTCDRPRSGAPPASAPSAGLRPHGEREGTGTVLSADLAPGGRGRPAGAGEGFAGDTNEFTGVRILNNIFVGGASPLPEGAPGVFCASNYVGLTPGFTDPTNADFTLAADSLCIDAGCDAPEVTDSFVGGAPDIGAYEFGRAEWRAGADVAAGANRVRVPRARLVLESGTAGAEIRYSLDGRDPTLSSPLYTGAVDVVRSATLRIRAFRPGMEPSPSTTLTVVPSPVEHVPTQ